MIIRIFRYPESRDKNPEFCHLYPKKSQMWKSWILGVFLYLLDLTHFCLAIFLIFLNLKKSWDIFDPETGSRLKSGGITSETFQIGLISDFEFIPGFSSTDRKSEVQFWNRK